MRHVALAIFASAVLGCMNHRVKGSTEHATHSDVSGEVRIILQIDVTACDSLPEADQLQCVLAILDTFKDMQDLLKTLKVEQLPSEADSE